MTSLGLCLVLAVLPALAAPAQTANAQAANTNGAKVMPIAAGPFQGNVDSLKQYKCPDWFRDAKFGIWAHWGPQAVPGQGDWYARKMYMQGTPDYKSHLAAYGHPSKAGYKDIIPLWKAEKWDPAALIALYKKAGAHYFVSMGCHHDNFDLWNSTYHSWNAVKMGPNRDIVGDWQKAAKAAGLPFGVSEHLGASYIWYTPAHGSDKTGPLAGVPYDGADPAYQELYHTLDPDPANRASPHLRYTAVPANQEDWQRRIHDLIDQYHPDLLYSDGGLPFGAVGEATVAHLFNTSIAAHGGKLEAVYNCKHGLTGEYIPGACVRDVERGIMSDIQPYPWQTDSSNGDWFYRKGDKYKTTSRVLNLLSDIISKNGNLLLNIVLQPDGSLPPESKQLLEGLSAWMAVNSEAIFGTRPWSIYGEGPTAATAATAATGATKGAIMETVPFTAQDIRFTTKGSVLYAICLGIPTGSINIKTLAKNSSSGVKTISGVTLLGSGEKVDWRQGDDALVIQPAKTWPSADEVVFKIIGALPAS